MPTVSCFLSFLILGAYMTLSFICCNPYFHPLFTCFPRFFSICLQPQLLSKSPWLLMIAPLVIVAGTAYLFCTPKNVKLVCSYLG